MEQKSPSKFKLPVTGCFHTYGAFRNYIGLAVILLLLLIGLYVALRSGKSQIVSKRSYFTVVVDCGSSGTRVSVYEWMMKRGLGDQVLPILIHSYPENSTDGLSGGSSCTYHCLQTEPGLDKFVGNYSGVRASLEPLISRAENWVPPERHSDTPIFVLATAGLRRLPREDAASVLEDVEAVVEEHAFMHRKSWIRVLSGREEAYYGWVALNYKMGNLKKTPALRTLGLLDLGGSSLQVVMEIDKKQEDELFLKSNIGSFEHQILAYSWPAFGLNEAFDRTVIMLSHSQALRESSGGILEISHPCLSSSFVQNYTCKGCFGISSTDLESSQIQAQRNEFSSILLVGNPSWDRCKILAKAAALNSSSSDWSWLTDGSNCKAVWVPLTGSKMQNWTVVGHRVARFHALSGFFAVYTTLNLSPKANLTKVWEEGQQLCSRSWADSSTISGNQKYAAQYCFRVPYMISLIEDTLCLSNKEIIFGPGDVSWTLGAALVEGEFLWHSSFRVQSNILNRENTWLISSSILLFVLLVCLLFIVYHSQIKLPMLSRKVAVVAASLPMSIRPNRRPK